MKIPCWWKRSKENCRACSDWKSGTLYFWWPGIFRKLGINAFHILLYHTALSSVYPFAKHKNRNYAYVSYRKTNSSTCCLSYFSCPRYDLWPLPSPLSSLRFKKFRLFFFLFGFILLPFSLRHYLCYRNATVDKLNPLNNTDTEEIIRWTGWVTQAEGSTGCRFCLDRAKKLILTFAA